MPVSCTSECMWLVCTRLFISKKSHWCVVNQTHILKNHKLSGMVMAAKLSHNPFQEGKYQPLNRFPLNNNLLIFFQESLSPLPKNHLYGDSASSNRSFQVTATAGNSLDINLTSLFLNTRFKNWPIFNDFSSLPFPCITLGLDKFYYFCKFMKILLPLLFITHRRNSLIRLG